MTRDGSRRRIATLLALIAASTLVPAGASAQAVDCTALRDEIDSLAPSGGDGRYDVALRQQRDEIARARDSADDSGCEGDGGFDDPNSALCRGLAQRVRTLETGLQRLEDGASRGDPAGDARRRALEGQFASTCATDGETPMVAMPVDPDAPAAPDARSRSARILCVRHCDGAYYPLAVEVSADRMPDMDRICQAQCPAAASSAYAGDADDVSGAVASDGSPYSALPKAFGFLKGSLEACACRAPHQSWADALAGAEALIEYSRGDVTVTAAVSAAMARPATPAPKEAAPTAAAKAPRRAKPLAFTAPAIAPPDPGRDLTRAFRRAEPTP